MKKAMIKESRKMIKDCGYVLALDTSTQTLTVAVIHQGSFIAKASVAGVTRHSDRLLPVCKRLLNLAGIEVKDLELIAIGKGPGSFTGLRVGHSFAKGLAMVDDIPVVPFSSMELVAYNVAKTHRVIAVILDARRDKFYLALFLREGKSLITKQKTILVTREELAARLNVFEALAITGDALRRYSKDIAALVPQAHLCPQRDWNARPAHLLRVLEAADDLKMISAMKLIPDYLRLTEPEEKWNLQESKGA